MLNSLHVYLLGRVAYFLAQNNKVYADSSRTLRVSLPRIHVGLKCFEVSGVLWHPDVNITVACATPCSR